MGGEIPLGYHGGDDDEGVPAKLMLFVGVVGVLGLVLLFITMSNDRKSPDGLYDPQSQVYQETSSELQEDSDLWVPKKPPAAAPSNTGVLPSPLDHSPLKVQESKPLFPRPGEPYEQQQKPPASQPG